MKKPPKLVLRKETLRALSGTDLAYALGGLNADTSTVTTTNLKACPAPAVLAPGG